MRQSIATTAALAASIFSAAVLAQQATCGPGKKCPAESPCCSLYGQCGIGAYCVGNCDPLFSNTLNSCVPQATCKSQTYDMSSLDDVDYIDKYLGDNDGINWVASGKPLIYEDSLLLTMAEGTVGTLLGSTHYVWYGKICAEMTSSRGKGVVTAFIMMSDVKDEIDYEWVGLANDNVQSNYYSQGVTDYTNGKELPVGNTESEFHEYCIDWTEDTLTWLIDGNTQRTVKRSETWNSTANRFDYPQTPSRIMLSLWPAGLPSNAEGTIEWAGGEIEWASEYMQNGYYYSVIRKVTVDCYDPPPMAQIKGDKTYVYTDEAGTNNTVQISDTEIILANFYSSGDNPGDPESTDQPPAPTGVETVPGMSGIGNQAENADETTGGGDGGDTDGGDTSGGGGDGGFNQGNQGGGGTNGAAGIKTHVLGGSFLAVWVGVLALLIL